MTKFYTQTPSLLKSHGKIDSLGSVQSLSLKTGAGPDSITQSSSTKTLFVFPKVVVDGGGGTNSFLADDSGFTAAAPANTDASMLFALPAESTAIAEQLSKLDPPR